MNETVSPLSLADDWQKHVQAWKLSGLSKTQFCKINALCYHRFIYWCSKLEKPTLISSSKLNNHGGFVPVQFQSNKSRGLTLALPNGCVLQGISTENLSLVRLLLDQFS